MLPSFVPVVLFSRCQPDYLAQNNVLIKRDSRWREIYEVLAARMRKLITTRARKTDCSHARKCSQRPFDTPSIRWVFLSYSQPIRFARFDGKSVSRGLPVLDQARATPQQNALRIEARALDPCHGPEGLWALVTRIFRQAYQRQP